MLAVACPAEGQKSDARQENSDSEACAEQEERDEAAHVATADTVVQEHAMMVKAYDTVPARAAVARLGYPLVHARLTVTEVVKRGFIVYLVIMEDLPLLLVQVHRPGVDLVVILAAEHEQDSWIAALNREVSQYRGQTKKCCECKIQCKQCAEIILPKLNHSDTAKHQRASAD